MNNEEIAASIATLDQRIRSAQHQIDDMRELTNSIHELASEVRFMRTDINKMQTDIDEIKAKPSKRYELAVTSVITALTGGIAGYIISNLI